MGHPKTFYPMRTSYKLDFKIYFNKLHMSLQV